MQTLAYQSQLTWFLPYCFWPDLPAAEAQAADTANPLINKHRQPHRQPPSNSRILTDGHVADARHDRFSRQGERGRTSMSSSVFRRPGVTHKLLLRLAIGRPAGGWQCCQAMEGFDHSGAAQSTTPCTYTSHGFHEWESLCVIYRQLRKKRQRRQRFC